MNSLTWTHLGWTELRKQKQQLTANNVGHYTAPNRHLHCRAKNRTLIFCNNVVKSFYFDNFWNAGN